MGAISDDCELFCSCTAFISALSTHSPIVISDLRAATRIAVRASCDTPRIVHVSVGLAFFVLRRFALIQSVADDLCDDVLRIVLLDVLILAVGHLGMHPDQTVVVVLQLPSLPVWALRFGPLSGICPLPCGILRGS